MDGDWEACAGIRRDGVFVRRVLGGLVDGKRGRGRFGM